MSAIDPCERDAHQQHPDGVEYDLFHGKYQRHRRDRVVKRVNRLPPNTLFMEANLNQIIFMAILLALK